MVSKDAQKAIDAAQTEIDNTHAAVEEAQVAIQGAVNDKHAELLSKQEACVADVAKVRELLEEQAKQRQEEEGEARKTRGGPSTRTDGKTSRRAWWILMKQQTH
ncbi:hypothetical protein GGR55DRAFT_22568 [Xylaria sp. FL0064]|nr:hypothetical protein GGR55DRAFT_22568 [Xylaria sp. FL0064]